MKTLFILCVMCISLSAMAQDTLRNPSFDKWEDRGRYEDPEFWRSVNKEATDFGISPNTVKSSDARSGPYACQMTTIVAFGIAIPGGITNGEFEADIVIIPTPSATVDITGGQKMQGNVIGIKGWYKYSVENDSDDAYVGGVKTRWNSSTNQRDTLSFTYESIPPVAEYTEFSVDFIDMVPGVKADTFLVFFLSGTPETGTAGGKLLLEDVSLIRELYATDDLYDSVDANGDFDMFVLDNDVNDLNEELTIEAISAPTRGSISLSGDESYFIWSPGGAVNNGIDSFMYILCNQDELCDTGVVYMNVKNGVGVPDKNSSITWSIQPNPASDLLFVDGLKNAKTLRLVNIQGQIVYQHQLNSENALQLDVANFPSGLYFVQIVTNTEKLEILKFTKN